MFALNDLTTPLLTTHAIDATYAGGVTGIFVYSNTGDGLGPADAVFDNFSADVAGPADHTIAYWRFEEGQADDQFAASGRAVDEAGHDDPLPTVDDSPGPKDTERESVGEGKRGD